MLAPGTDWQSRQRPTMAKGAHRARAAGLQEEVSIG